MVTNSGMDRIRVSMMNEVAYEEQMAFCAWLNSLLSPVGSAVELRMYLLLHHPPRRRSHKKLFVDTVSETVWNTTWKPEQARDMMTDVQQHGCLEERETELIKRTRFTFPEGNTSAC